MRITIGAPISTLGFLARIRETGRAADVVEKVSEPDGCSRETGIDVKHRVHCDPQKLVMKLI